MLCDVCQTRQAKIFYTEIVNGQKKEQHLCEQCASEYTAVPLNELLGGQGLSSVGSILSGILSSYAKGKSLKNDDHKETVCPECGYYKNGFASKKVKAANVEKIQSKAEEIYGKAKEIVPVLPKDELTKKIIHQAIEQLNTASKTVEDLRTLMNETASKLPEYDIVMAMKGVGPSLGPQLMAEIGDVTRFTHKSAITAFAGVDPGVNESGTYNQKSVPVTKRGSAHLRKALFQVMDILIKTHPEDDDVYKFLDKKRSEGKPYFVYMTAGANKFLRIYYGRVKEYMSNLP